MTEPPSFANICHSESFQAVKVVLIVDKDLSVNVKMAIKGLEKLHTMQQSLKYKNKDETKGSI